MRFAELPSYIEDNELLMDCRNECGIYAITVDSKIVYIGKSQNIFRRCAQHIYNIQNAALNQEKKYLLLLAAQLGGLWVDCITIDTCKEDQLAELESYYIDHYNPPLNILTPSGKQDISDRTIRDLL